MYTRASIARLIVCAGLCTALPEPLTAGLRLTFFGEDLGLGEDTPLGSFPNATAAQAEFLANLVGVGVEDLEAFADGTSAPVMVDFGEAGTATLLGNGAIDSVALGTTNGFGRYATSGASP